MSASTKIHNTSCFVRWLPLAPVLVELMAGFAGDDNMFLLTSASSQSVNSIGGSDGTGGPFVAPFYTGRGIFNTFLLRGSLHYHSCYACLVLYATSPQANHMEDGCSLRKRRSGLLNVWTVPSLEEAVPDSTLISVEFGEEEKEMERGRELKNGKADINIHACIEGGSKANMMVNEVLEKQPHLE